MEKSHKWVIARSLARSNTDIMQKYISLHTTFRFHPHLCPQDPSSAERCSTVASSAGGLGNSLLCAYFSLTGARGGGACMYCACGLYAGATRALRRRARMNQRTRARAPRSATPPIAMPAIAPPVSEGSEEAEEDGGADEEGDEDERIDERREEEAVDKGDAVGVDCEEMVGDMACDDDLVVVYVWCCYLYIHL